MTITRIAIGPPNCRSFLQSDDKYNSVRSSVVRPLRVKREPGPSMVGFGRVTKLFMGLVEVAKMQLKVSVMQLTE